MNTVQRVVAAFGVVALICSLAWAPYEYVGHDEIDRLKGEDISIRREVVAPFWSPPTGNSLMLASARARETGDSSYEHRVNFRVDAIQLDTGRLSITVLSIAALTLMLIAALASPTRPPSS